MLSPRESHFAVSIGNKMFVIGGSFSGRFNVKVPDNFEVVDSVSRKFTSIKRLPKWINYLDPHNIVCVGYSIYCFTVEENNEVRVNSYDIKEKFLSFKTLWNLEDKKRFSCTKVPMY